MRTVFQGCILGEIAYLALVQRRNILGATPVEGVRKTHEMYNVLGVFNFCYPVF